MRLIGLAVVLSLILAPLAAEAQQVARPRVGVTTQSSANYDAFLQVLREAGWINGQNITVELRTGFGEREQVPKIVAEILALKVDVIVAGSPLVIAAFKNATTTIPIVANDFESDPVARGFVASFARPGRNITGVFLDLPELAGKQLQFLKETAPGLARVAVLWEPDIGEHQLQATKNAARSAGLSLEPLGVVKAGDFAPAFDRAVRARAQAVVVLTSPIMMSNRRQIAELALKYRLPTISPFIILPEAGALMAYGPSHPEIFRRLASYVDKILRGANPGDLPLERPSKFELVINLKTAKALGLTIPQSVLGRADHVIEQRVLDQRGQLLRAALGFAGLSTPPRDRALHALRTLLDSWSGIGHVAVGMHRQGYDLQLTQYDERGWRATFYTTGMEHSPTSATGTGWERTPGHATQRAAWAAITRAT